MVDLNAIQSINSIVSNTVGHTRENPVPVEIEDPEQSTQPGFADVINDFIHSVNDKQMASVDKANAIIKGDSQDLVGAMSSMEESRLSFQLLLEIRNKLLDSYKEIQRMQI